LTSRFLELDAEFSQRLRIAETPGALRTACALIAHSGDSWLWYLGLGILWLIGPESWKRTLGIILAAILGAAIIVAVLKYTIRRKRPEGEWGSIYRLTDPHSFPSGHAARATLLAVLATNLLPSWLAILMLGWAFLVILARVAMGVHYLSDVIAGAIIGAALAGIVLSFFL